MNTPSLSGQQVRALAADGMPGHEIAELMVKDGTMSEIGAYEYVSFLLHGDGGAHDSADNGLRFREPR